MSLFGKQLQDKINHSEREIQYNLKALGDSVFGRTRASFAYDISSLDTDREIRNICRFLKIDVPDESREFSMVSDAINFILRPSGATKREVELTDTWWRSGDGPLLARFQDTGRYIALLPGSFMGYYYIDPATGKKVWITRKKAAQFDRTAYCFYKPLPNRPLSGIQFIRFIMKQLTATDRLILITAALLIAVFGMVTPFATRYAFSSVIPSGSTFLLIPLGIWLFSLAISTWLLNVVKMSVNSRMVNRLEVFCQNAVYSRIIRFPVSFFSDKSAGGMAQKVKALSQLPGLLIEQVYGTFLSVAFSLVYVVQLFFVAEPLVLPAFIVYIAEIVLFVWMFLQEKKLTQEYLSANEKNSGLVFSFLSGIQKIRISGSRKQAFAKWLEGYTRVIRPSYAIRFPSSFRGPLVTFIHMLGMLWIYMIAVSNHLSVAQFTSFSSAFGMMMGGMLALHASGRSFSLVRPILKMGEPILKNVPETSEGKRQVNKLTGKISLNRVSFRYSPDSPLILDNINLEINPGEYVAIAGQSGCGKSTLMRILLGFEDPQTGSVTYDGMEMQSIDRQSLRRNIGTVLQDGQLFNGDLLYNIIITAPWMKAKDAWEAAEKAGVAEDIRKMPMGMHTMVTEAGSGISGGQKQRILIARAICPRPAILMLDEATSALDNVTQKIVTDSMNEMNCTRIVIAHRLSTIRDCDRIIVLDHGKIIEDGTYEELYAKNGLFTELVKRQMLEEKA